MLPFRLASSSRVLPRPRRPRGLGAGLAAVGLILAAPATGGAAGPPRVGDRVVVAADALPAPAPETSVANPPERVARPAAAVPAVPGGFSASLFADGLSHARWLAVAPGGDVFLAEPRAGKVTVLRDGDGDGRAETRGTWVDGLHRPHGLAFGHGGVYVADLDAVWFMPYTPGALTTPEAPRQVTPDGALGDGAGHWTRTIALAADGRTLYVAIGSRGNIAEEDPPRATVRAFDLSEDGRSATNPRTFASGLRNPVGLVLQPGTGVPWTVVNERDGLGDGLVPDFLARLEDGAFYGWPYAYSGGHPQPGFAGDISDKVARSRSPDLLFEAHVAPLGLVFYDGTAFPEAMRGDAFVAFHGSWNAKAPRGYAIVRVPFEDGRPRGGYTYFATGFWSRGDDTATVWGRPAGLAVAADGALLVADDVGQVVWRIAHD
jgi:glucose/arabinose dehydrogenase